MPLSEANFAKFIQIIPLKYCNYKIEDKIIKLNACFDFFYKPFREVYKNISITDFINIANITENRGELGNIFDSLVNYNYDVNKFIFGYKISYVIIVNEIVNFSKFISIINDEKDYFNTKINYEKLFDGKIIYLEQKNTNGIFVDGGFLIPDKEDNYSFSLLLYQSSILKRIKFTKQFIYDIIYKNSKYNIEKMFNIKINKVYFMYIIDQGDISTANYCKKTGIYYIYYSIKDNMFYFCNYKSITLKSKIDLSLLEINEPDPLIIEKIEKIDKENDISEIKKILLNKKRNKSNKSKKNQKNKKKPKIEIIYDKKIKGFTNPNVKFKNIKSKKNEEKQNELELDEEENLNNKIDENIMINLDNSELNQKKPIPHEWKKIFGTYNDYKLIKKAMFYSNAKFELPIFYISNNKYLILKNKNKYSIYYKETGEIVNESERKQILISFSLFNEEFPDDLYLDVYVLE